MDESTAKQRLRRKLYDLGKPELFDDCWASVRGEDSAINQKFSPMVARVVLDVQQHLRVKL
jgi:hypothetical protein